MKYIAFVLVFVAVGVLLWSEGRPYRFTATLVCRRCKVVYTLPGTSKGHAKDRVLRAHAQGCTNNTLHIRVDKIT